MQLFIDEDYNKDYEITEYYPFYKNESSPHCKFIYKYAHIEDARRGIENHKLKYAKNTAIVKGLLIR